MKTVILTARVPQYIIDAIDEYQRREKLEFRQDALIDMVKVACDAVGIDMSQPTKTQQNSQMATQKCYMDNSKLVTEIDCQKCEVSELVKKVCIQKREKELKG